MSTEAAYTYSRWDGTQVAEDIDPDVLIAALAAAVVVEGDVNASLRRLAREGLAGNGPDRLAGIEHLLEDARRERAAAQRGAETVPQERLARALHTLGPDPETQRVAAAARDLNALLAAHRAARDQTADSSCPRHKAPVLDEDSLSALVRDLCERWQRAAELLARLPSAAGKDLTKRVDSAASDPSCAVELERLDRNLEALAGGAPSLQDRTADSRGCRGPAQAQRIADLNAIEEQLQWAQRGESLDEIDGERLERALGRGARETLARLQALPDALVDAGYLRSSGQEYELTARGLRRIGQKAVDDIFRDLPGLPSGEHPADRGGPNSGQSEHHRRYEPGDPFLLNLNRTLLNAAGRGGSSRPLRLTVDDFEVYETERVTKASTVLLVDVSPSMPMRGCLAAARKVALALTSLIESRFPHDSLDLVAFSDYARRVDMRALHTLAASEDEFGTNMQHALLLARKLLGRHRAAARQIILITDGEPTAHLENGKACFAYPPAPRTFEETLKEVARCTREDIVINTFMLERSQFLTDFVGAMTRINRGRAFFTAPERLGEYVLVDYALTRARRR